MAGRRVSSTTTIYALCDPVSSEIRYIGKTTQPPTSRLSAHMQKSRTRKAHVSHWIRSLNGQRPVLRILALVETGMAAETERKAIARFRASGCRLTNLTEGGEGSLGYRVFGRHPPLEVRAKMSASQKGKKHSPETLAKLSLSHLGHPVSAETRRKIGLGRRGKRHSVEAKARMSAASKGRSLSAEHKAAIVAANTGRPCSPETRALISTAARNRRINNTPLERSEV